MEKLTNTENAASLQQVISNQNKIITKLNEMISCLNTCMANIPYIYKQTDKEYTKDNAIHISASKVLVNSKSLFYVLPNQNSGNVEGGSSLTLDFSDAAFKQFTIKKEDSVGNFVDIGIGDIVAGKIATFRFAGNNKDVILCNSGLLGDVVLGDVKCNRIQAINGAYVGNKSGDGEALVTLNELNSTFENIDETFQKKIVFGSEDYNSYVELNGELPEGSVYMQTIEEE